MDRFKQRAKTKKKGGNEQTKRNSTSGVHLIKKEESSLSECLYRNWQGGI